MELENQGLFMGSGSHAQDGHAVKKGFDSASRELKGRLPLNLV